ncbi:MAG: Gfo/Idh/MocA family protein, partial [Halanaerobiales bacterium]
MERNDCQIVGLVDLEIDKTNEMVNKYGLNAETSTNLASIIEKTDANLVFDVTVPKAHYETVITALKSGCNVLGEKPMAASLEEAKEMVRVSEETGQMYAVMQNRRFLKSIRAYRELLAKGVIGEIGMVCVDFFLGAHFKGFRTIMESPLILDMAIHTFDQARFLIRSEPVSVYCQELNPPGSWYKGDAAAVCIFECADGSVFAYRGSWCAEGAQTSWEGSWRITGSKGTAIWQGGELYAEVVKSARDEFMNQYKRIDAEYNLEGREVHQGCLDEMFTSLKEGRNPETDCRDNIISMAMVFGALESSRKGRKVDIRLNK